MKFADISQHQKTIDYNKFIIPTIFKATEGVGFKDAKYNEHNDKLLNKMGVYHFARPDLGNTAKAEVDWFLSVAGLNHGIYMLDFEVNFENDVSWCAEFLKYLKSKVGNKTIWFYTYTSRALKDWGDVENTPLVVAEYGTNNGLPQGYNQNLTWKAGIVAHQYTSKGTIEGYVGPIDLNVKLQNVNVPFRGGYTITQVYGNNVAYYSQVSNGSLTKGHEGLDLIPKTSDWGIYSISDGEVIKDIDGYGQGGAYGNYVIIWDKENNVAWGYAHNASNIVSMGQKIKKGEKIATMGATGNVNGAHLHLNMMETDENGIRINKDNGNLGFLDPLPALQGLMVTETNTNDMLEMKKTIPESIFNTTKELVDLLKIKAIDKKDAPDTIFGKYLETFKKIQEYKKEILKLEEQLKNSEGSTGPLNIRIKELSEYVTRLEIKETTLNSEIGLLKTKLATDTSFYEGKIVDLEKQLSDVKNRCTQALSFFDLLKALLGLKQ